MSATQTHDGKFLAVPDIAFQTARSGALAVHSLQSPKVLVSVRLRNSPLKPKEGLSGPPVIFQHVVPRK